MAETACRICDSGRADEIRGKSLRDAAAALGVTVWAVRQHVRHTAVITPEPSYDVPIDAPIGKRWEVRRFSVNEGLRGTTRNIGVALVDDDPQLPDETYSKLRTYALSTEPAPPVAPSDKRTYVIMVADPQLGKKGTSEAVENWKRGIRGHVREAQELGVGSVHIAYMGDETEGVANNYRNQAHTVELNQSRQLELDFSLRCWTHRFLASEGYSDHSASSVISNHGEWTRNGDKDPVTTRNDNSSTFIARMVRQVFDETSAVNIDWTIGEAGPGVVVDLGGVQAYFTHGHVEKGSGRGVQRFMNAMQRQILGDYSLSAVSLFIGAHYHHFEAASDRSHSFFMCPALEAEGSSEYMRELYGVWSPAGMLGLVADPAHRLGWTNPVIL